MIGRAGSLGAQPPPPQGHLCRSPAHLFARGAATVAIAVSGGVDSAVAAHLLQRQGYRLVGLHVRSWDARDETGSCSGEQDLRDAQHVCQKLGIPLHEVDLVREYWLDVFEPFLRQLEDGYTPNPDLLCNVHVKFGPMWKHAQMQLGADLLATGHYAQLQRAPLIHAHTRQQGIVGDGAGCTELPDYAQLSRAVDETKDQSYFLASVSQVGRWIPLAQWQHNGVVVVHIDVG